MDDLFSVSTSTKKEDILFQNNEMREKNNKNKKDNGSNINIKKIFIFIIFFIILALIIFFSMSFFKKSKSPKEYILKVLEKTDILGMLNIEDFKKLSNTLNTKSFELKADGNINPKFLDKEENKKDKENTENTDKLMIKDFEFIFQGAVNNNEEAKSNLIETSILWDKTNITSWSMYENKDMILFEAPEYFKEIVGINKNGLDKVFKNNSPIAKTYKELLFSKDENLFEEIEMLGEAIKKSLLNSIEKLSDVNFSVEKKIPTSYKNEKLYADNYKIVIDKITLDIIFENLMKDIDTSLKIDASRYKNFSKNEIEIKNLIRKFKPDIRENEKIEVLMYKIKDGVPKLDIILKRENEDIKILQLEIDIKESGKNSEKDDKNLVLIFQETKMSVNLKKENDAHKVSLNLETLKENLTDIKPKDIEIKKPNEEREEKQNTDITINSLNKSDLMANNEIGDEIIPDTNSNSISNININKEDEKESDKLKFKMEFSIPINTSSSNMKIVFNIYSNILDAYLDIKLKFQDNIIIESIDGDRVFLDKLSDTERDAMVKNLIEPTIISVTSRKLDEIAKKKNAIANQNNNQIRATESEE